MNWSFSSRTSFWFNSSFCFSCNDVYRFHHHHHASDLTLQARHLTLLRLWMCFSLRLHQHTPQPLPHTTATFLLTPSCRTGLTAASSVVTLAILCWSHPSFPSPQVKNLRAKDAADTNHVSSPFTRQTVTKAAVVSTRQTAASQQRKPSHSPPNGGSDSDTCEKKKNCGHFKVNR